MIIEIADLGSEPVTPIQLARYVDLLADHFAAILGCPVDVRPVRGADGEAYEIVASDGDDSLPEISDVLFCDLVAAACAPEDDA